MSKEPDFCDVLDFDGNQTRYIRADITDMLEDSLAAACREAGCDYETIHWEEAALSALAIYRKAKGD